MSDIQETALRLGLLLYRKTIAEGPGPYLIYDLVFPDNVPVSFFDRIFRGNEGTFWGLQQDAARFLDSVGIANCERRHTLPSVTPDYLLRLTSFGKRLYGLAQSSTDNGPADMAGITIEDLSELLQSDVETDRISQALSNIGQDLDALKLSNFQRASAQAHVSILVTICSLPERDSKLFWAVLERISHIAGVLALVVSILTYRTSQ